LIADVVRVEYWEHGREFFITYRESSVEDVVVEYSARSESDRGMLDSVDTVCSCGNGVVYC
jgi:hypothetical protein